MFRRRGLFVLPTPVPFYQTPRPISQRLGLTLPSCSRDHGVHSLEGHGEDVGAVHVGEGRDAEVAVPMGSLIGLPSLVPGRDDRVHSVFLDPKVLDVGLSKVSWAPRVQGHVGDFCRTGGHQMVGKAGNPVAEN